MINHQHKFIYLHIPKAASLSIKRSLPHLCDLSSELKIPHIEEVKGMSIARMNRLDASTWNDYFRFSFVRNPWSRIVSAWRYLEGTSESKFRLREKRHFRRFVKQIGGHICSPTKDFDHWRWHLLPQYRHLIDRNGDIAMHFIGRVEDLEVDFDFVCRKIKFTHTGLQHVNQTRHLHYSNYYDRKSRETVARLYEDDISLFNYNFENEPLK